ncbi:MAG: HNH endonuclease signature motif containing protein [Sphaerochaeta sp.]|nr:HNH endonuclease signature motif containing protein [Sphaerochaeta sp.]
MGFPPLQQDIRGREFTHYPEEKKMEIVYRYLFEGCSHRMLDRLVLGLDPLESKGWQSMSILHFLGLRDVHKNFFEGLPLQKALKFLESYIQDGPYLLIYSFLRDYGVMTGEFEQDDGNASLAAEFEGKAWIDCYLHGVEDPLEIEARLRKIPSSSKEFRFRNDRYYLSSSSLKEALKCTYDFYCQVCHTRIYRPKWAQTLQKKEQWKYLNADVHHILPLSQGGEDLQENMLCLCPNCHRRFHTQEQILQEKQKHLYAFNQITGEQSLLQVKHTIMLL